VDLNPTLVATGLIGTVAARPGLAHPRALAITNNGDASDDDESVLVTEWYAQRTAPESADGKNSDTNKAGLVYQVAVADGAQVAIQLPPVLSTGFVDHNNGATGCFPNQVGAISIDQGFAYVTSTCASPVGPIGVFQKGACTSTAGCASFGAGSVCSSGVCTLSCVQNSDCASVGGTCTAGSCSANTTDVKTTTHPAVSIVDLAAGTATTSVLDALFSAKASARMPHRPADVGFFNGFGYVAATGADGVFRLVTASGAITDVGSATNNFINLRKDAADTLLRNPIGIATGFTQAFAFVANDGSRDVTALAFNVQAIAGNQVDDFRITESSALPAAGSPEDKILRGKRFFGTGLGRWSLKGEAWGSCAACHEDGLTDNVTWYFARGPRQSVSLDGSFASKDPTDQRIFNWTAIFDEVADFEGNIRGVSGGVGAIVSALSSPPANADRINTAAEVPPQQGLQGSSSDVADPLGQSAHPHSKLSDWEEVEAYIQSIRSPRRPTNLVQADVDAGKILFEDPAKGDCVGCHSGAKWTISKVFFPRGDIANAATADAATTSLSNQDWSLSLNGFPSALFPIKTAAQGGTAVLGTDSRMRFGAAPASEQIQCILRPVGTFGVSPVGVNVVELRQDMSTAAQGNADTGRGYNPPSLLGLSVGAPYFHAGNARSLEEVLDGIFAGHHTSAVAQVFVPDATKTKQLVAYLLSIDEDELAPPLAAKNGSGGDICSYQ
jgi:mono/diheme cytochrome c family protein